MASISIRAAVRHVLAGVLILAPFHHASAVSSRQLVEIVDFNSPVVSPDGQRVAFRIAQGSIERNTYDTAWYVQRMDGRSPPRRVADGGLPLRDSAGIAVPATAVWSPDGRWIYYRACLQGRIDVWRASADGDAAEPVTRDAADVRDFRLGDDGKVLRYSVGPTREEVAAAEQAEYDRGIRVDRATPLGQNLFRSGYTEGRPATQRLGLVFNRVALTDAVPDRWKAVELEAGAARDSTASDAPAPAPTAPDLARDVDNVWKTARDPDNRRIALLTRTEENRDRPKVELGMLPIGRSGTPGRLLKCTAEQCRHKAISGVQWRPGSDEVLFTVTGYDEGFAQSIFRWNTQTGAVHAVAAASGLFAGEGRWGPGTCGVSSTALACVTAEANRPPRLERIDLQTGERQVLFDPNAALSRELAAIPMTLLRWKDAQGRRFTGWLYSASRTGDAAPPLFVTYYRCMGFVRGGSGDEWPLAAMAEQGISTLCINAPSFPADAVQRYDAGQSAVESAIAWRASEGRIDGSRVGMGGLSFGSEVTMWALIHSDMIAAASMASPSTSQMYYLLGSNIGEAFQSALRSNWQLGAPGETPEQWQRISPASNLERINAPILMQFPEQEYMHGLDYAIPLMRRNRADLYVFPHETHNKFQPRHKLAVYERNLDWFGFWLLGVEDPDPAKAQQYAHWRSMRSDAGGERAAAGANDSAPAGRPTYPL